jgi:predicted alpha/beta-hydrolase family hydrolase
VSRLKCLLTCLCLLRSVVDAAADEIVTLATRAGVSESYFIGSEPKNPQAIAVLFRGSGGLVGLQQGLEQVDSDNDNFLVRSRGEFSKRGVVVAIVDAPSDQQRNWGMTDEFRLGEQHFTDISAVVADLQGRFSGLPLFLVGTSRGTISAAALGARLGSRVGGVVLTATVFRQAGRKSKEAGPGLSRFDFATIKVPLLFVHHVSDHCGVTPYGDAARFSMKYPIITVYGGKPAESDSCSGFSAHGFFGKESETVEQIVNWMLKKPFQSEVR